ncbi:uncharacterized protein N7511_000249 [Penicillium nucicola]|uniref:uncharacterized protein n=1 Tax=Penicillium nucicola TaxID=1850975 RepID=UPI00254545F6|nr:uncharacterized protein N7511_000249 [Penicillium nucicola]KAJ5775238.1 hypothetical protein N7511_000249 [Penicillium nucicola]
MAKELTSTFPKDPIDWSVEDVVSFLWPQVPHKWACSISPPDLALLGPIFRARGINGRVLLESVNSELLKMSMGVTKVGERVYILHVIRYLKERSAAFDHRATLGQSILVQPTTPATDISLSPKTTKQPRRAENILTTPLTPVPRGRVPDPALWSPLPAGLTSATNMPSVASQVSTTTPGSATDLESATKSAHQPTDYDLCPEFKAFIDGVILRNPPEENDQDALPLYGESDSSDWESDERREIEDLPEKKPPGVVPPTPTGPVSLARFNEIVDNLISEQRQTWMDSITNEMCESSGLFTEGRDGNAIKNRAKGDLQRLQRRLESLRDAIYGHRHTTAALIIKSCDSLLETLKDMFFCEWRLSMLNSLDISQDKSQQGKCDQNDQIKFPTYGFSSSPGFYDISSSSSDDSDDSDQSSEEKGELCDSDDSDLDTDKTTEKKPRLEGVIPNDAVVIDLTGDSPVVTEPDMSLQTTKINDNLPFKEEYVVLFEETYVPWEIVESTGYRPAALAKNIRTLSRKKLKKLAVFVGRFGVAVHRELIQAALKGVVAKALVFKGLSISESSHETIIARQFVSWVDGLRCEDEESFQPERIQQALAALERYENTSFDKFPDFLSLVYNICLGGARWLELQTQEKVQRGQNQMRPDSSLIGRKRHGQEARRTMSLGQENRAHPKLLLNTKDENSAFKLGQLKYPRFPLRPLKPRPPFSLTYGPTFTVPGYSLPSAPSVPEVSEAPEAPGYSLPSNVEVPAHSLHSAIEAPAYSLPSAFEVPIDPSSSHAGLPIHSLHSDTDAADHTLPSDLGVPVQSLQSDIEASAYSLPSDFEVPIDASPSDCEVPACPWYYDPPLQSLNLPPFPAVAPLVSPNNPPVSPAKPEAVSPMSEEGWQMYQ